MRRRVQATWRSLCFLLSLIIWSHLRQDLLLASHAFPPYSTWATTGSSLAKKMSWPRSMYPAISISWTTLLCHMKLWLLEISSRALESCWREAGIASKATGSLQASSCMRVLGGESHRQGQALLSLVWRSPSFLSPFLRQTKVRLKCHCSFSAWGTISY